MNKNMNIQALDEYLVRYTAVVSGAEQINNIIAANLEALTKLYENTKTIIDGQAEINIDTTRPTSTTTSILQLIRIMLQSSQHQIGLSMCLWAKRDHNVSLEQFIEYRNEAMQKCTKGQSSDGPKRLFRDIYKAVRDGLLVSIYNAEIVYNVDDDQRKSMLLMSTFCRHWVTLLLTRGKHAIQNVNDVVELNALWTQCVILNKSMAKQGVAFMPLLEQDFIDKGFNLCKIDTFKINPVEADKHAMEGALYSEFIDDPMAVGIANAIIDCINKLRHFAHPKLLFLMQKQVMEIASHHSTSLAQFAHQSWSTLAMPNAQSKPTTILQEQ